MKICNACKKRIWWWQKSVEREVFGKKFLYHDWDCYGGYHNFDDGYSKF